MPKALKNGPRPPFDEMGLGFIFILFRYVTVRLRPHIGGKYCAAWNGTFD